MAYTFDREMAAKELEVSTRTLDRYIKAGKIRSKKMGKKIFLNSVDIEAIKSGDENASAGVPEENHASDASSDSSGKDSSVISGKVSEDATSDVTFFPEE